MILVTGGAGNVGANVVRQLLDAGEKVRVITRNPSDRSFPDQVEVVPGDLTRPETLPAVLSGVDRAFLFPVLNAVDGFSRGRSRSRWPTRGAARFRAGCGW